MPTRNTPVQLLALYTNPESHNAQRHRQTNVQSTDGWTDIRQDYAKLQTAVRSAKMCIFLKKKKKLSFHRKTARQLLTWRGRWLGPPAHSPSAPSDYTYAYGRIQNPQQTYVKRTLR